MYAIVNIAGKQFRVSESDRLYVPLLKVEAGKKVTFDEVLLVGDDASTKVGTPTVAGASVSAEVLDHVRADKIVVFRKKRRKGYRVKKGHRQPYTQIQINGISVSGSRKKSRSKAAKAETEAETAE